MKQLFLLSCTALFLPLALGQKAVAPPRPAPSLKDAEEMLAQAAVTNAEAITAVSTAQNANPELPGKMVAARKDAAAATLTASAIRDKVGPAPIETVSGGAPDYIQASSEKSDKKKGKMRITAAATFFDSAKNEGVFTGGVVVDDPTMHIESDQLNVKLEDKDDKSTAPAPVAPKPPAVPGEAVPPAPEGEDEARIKTAVATGPKVYIRKPPTPKGKVQFGYCQKATYIGSTKDILMEKWAVVYDGPNIVRATSITTTILMKENGEFKVNGPNQVDIAKESTKGLKEPGAPSASAPR